MNALERRIDRLEDKLGMKPGPRELWVTNCDFTGDKAGEFLPGWYVHVYGPPLSEKELEEFRKEYHQIPPR